MRPFRVCKSVIVIIYQEISTQYMVTVTLELAIHLDAKHLLDLSATTKYIAIIGYSWMSWQIWPSVSAHSMLFKYSRQSMSNVWYLSVLWILGTMYLHGMRAPASVSSHPAPFHCQLSCFAYICSVMFNVSVLQCSPRAATLCLSIEAMSVPLTHKTHCVHHGLCAVTRIDRNMNSYERARSPRNSYDARTRSRLSHRRAQRNAPVYREVLNRTLGFYSMLSRTYIVDIDTIRWTLRTLNSLWFISPWIRLFLHIYFRFKPFPFHHFDCGALKRIVKIQFVFWIAQVRCVCIVCTNQVVAVVQGEKDGSDPNKKGKRKEKKQ